MLCGSCSNKVHHILLIGKCIFHITFLPIMIDSMQNVNWETSASGNFPIASEERILQVKASIEEKNVNKLRSLISSGISPRSSISQFKYKNVRRGNVPLISIAIAFNSIECVKLLIQAGADLEAEDVLFFFFYSVPFIFFILFSFFFYGV